MLSRTIALFFVLSGLIVACGGKDAKDPNTAAPNCSGHEVRNCDQDKKCHESCGTNEGCNKGCSGKKNAAMAAGCWEGPTDC